MGVSVHISFYWIQTHGQSHDQRGGMGVVGQDVKRRKRTTFSRILDSVSNRFVSYFFLGMVDAHVAVPVKRLDACQQFAVRADADEDLRVGADSRLEDRQRAVAELPLFLGVSRE